MEQQLEPENVSSDPKRNRSTKVSAYTLQRSFKQQIKRCWRLNPGLENLAVDLQVELRKDGTVQNVRFPDMPRFDRDPHFRAASENARRAVFLCSPFELPGEHYELWKSVSLRFDPREMLRP